MGTAPAALALPARPGETLSHRVILLIVAEGALLQLDLDSSAADGELSSVVRSVAGTLSLALDETEPFPLGRGQALFWPGQLLCSDHVAAATSLFLCADSGGALASQKALLGQSFRRLDLTLRRGRADRDRVPVSLEVVILMALPLQAPSRERLLGQLALPPSSVCVGEHSAVVMSAPSQPTPTFRLYRTLYPLSPLALRYATPT